MAGARRGAIMATLVAAGYTATELRATIMKFDFNGLKDRA